MLTVLLTVPALAIAAVPNIFSPGTLINAAQVNGNFANLDTRLAALETGGGARSTTYVRWGRTVCPAGANVVYTGYAAGAHQTHAGSGANTLCLHDTPQWLTFNDGDQNGALLYGTEFETTTFGVSSLTGVNDRDARCVVCEVPRANQILVPGRTSCPTGWTTEYNGYLMATHYTQVKSEWACVDAAPEATGDPANANGNLWYPTEAECGALPCSATGYVQNREITCAVCSK
jgi:hypothetical protein